MDFEKLNQAVIDLTRLLDNAVEISGNFAIGGNKKIILNKRRIGIGICGLADLFIKFHIEYSSKEAEMLTREILSSINYWSKF